MRPIDEALELFLKYFSPLNAESVPLADSAGRILATPLRAREDIPAFDNSAMDGYAVRAAEIGEGGATLPLYGESRAGGPSPEALPPGHTMRIFTGAPMPAGADAVVMQEDTERKQTTADTIAICFKKASVAGKHVRIQAEVIAAGAPLLDAGTELGAGEIGLCASQGYAQVPVHRRPKVALLATGDELREIGEPARPGSLIDSNTHAMAAAVRAAGGEVVILPRGGDELSELTAKVKEGIGSADVLVTSGGVSVGDYDLLHEAFRQAGVEEVFWKVRVKPGKPLRFGVAQGKPVVGLPGNPVSGLVIFELFVRPALRRMLGDPTPHRPLIEVQLGQSFKAPETRTELARVRLEHRVGHPPIAHKHAPQGSGALTSMAGLDALVVLREGAGEMAKGDKGLALDLKTSRGSAQAPF